MKTVAMVPIKMNNVRLPNKNILCFDNGDPLCTYILKTLLKVNEINQIYVYCSDERIKEYLPQGVQFLKRSTCLDQDTTKINEVISSFVKEIDSDVYILTHATAPFVKKDSLEKAVCAVTKEGYDSALAVRKIQDFMWKDGKPFNYDIKAIPRTQDLEPYFIETSGFYVFTKKIAKASGCRVGNKPKLIEVDEMESVDIDEKEDFEFANLLFRAKYYKN